VASLVVIAFLGHRYLSSWQARFLVLAVIASGIPLRLIESVGHYDVLFLLASVSLAFPKKTVWIAASVVGGLANAEVAVVAGVSVVLAALAFRDSTNVKKGLALAASGTVVTSGIWIASQASGTESGGRTSVFIEGIVPSLVGNLGWLPLLLATGYLGAWFVVVLIISGVSNTRRLALLISALVVVPGLMTLVTLDGTRVFVVTSAAALVLTIQTWIMRASLASDFVPWSGVSRSMALSLIFSVFVLVPEVSVFVLDPEVRIAPWQFLVDVLYTIQPELLP